MQKYRKDYLEKSTSWFSTTKLSLTFFFTLVGNSKLDFQNIVFLLS